MNHGVDFVHIEDPNPKLCISISNSYLITDHDKSDFGMHEF